MTNVRGPSVTLVAGSFPPDKCGIGDYTALLLQALQQRGAEADCYHSLKWSMRHLFAHWRRLRRIDHWLLLQHPAIGFDKRLAPFLLWMLLIRTPKVVTLHEFSRKSLHGKLLCYIFFICSRHVIFTSVEELQLARHFAPWLRTRASVIPIGSNIPFIPPQPKTVDVAYFGLIMPGKGLEEFLDIVTVLAGRRSVSIQLIGQVVSGAELFAETVFSRLRALGAQLVINADATTVAAKLAASRTVLLPFPDGISPRRGSALAAMGNGALVVTTPPPVEAAVQFGERCLLGGDATALLASIEAALNDPDRYTNIVEAGKSYAESFSWSDIAERHVDIFNQQPKALTTSTVKTSV